MADAVCRQGKHKIRNKQHTNNPKTNHIMRSSKKRSVSRTGNRAAAHSAYAKKTKQERAVAADAPADTPMVFYPLISCIMPTSGRPAYVAQSIKMFMQQDYPCKELIICFNDFSDLPAIQYPSQVRLLQVTTKIIGAKRNECCRHALGSIIAQWDDDDMYNTNRLSLQAAPILAGHAHITGFKDFIFYETVTGLGYTATPRLFNAAFQAPVHSGTLMFIKELSEVCRYPNWKCGEDFGFFTKAVKKGAVVVPLNGFNSFVYVRHRSNTWKFEENNFRRYKDWLPAAMPAWADIYAPFYVHMANTDNSQAEIPTLALVAA